MSDFNYENILKKLDQSWSIGSSSSWTQENHAKGQGGITAYLIYELYGGKMLKTPIMDGVHFYDEGYGETYDFTTGQLTEHIWLRFTPTQIASDKIL